jgi:hypothetical protein
MVGRLSEAVETAVLQVRNARRKLKAEQCAEREDVVGFTAAVGVMAASFNVAQVRVEEFNRVDSSVWNKAVGVAVSRGSCSAARADGVAVRALRASRPSGTAGKLVDGFRPRPYPHVKSTRSRYPTPLHRT